FVKAFTLAAFAMTAAFVGGLAAILPVGAWLIGMLGAIYSLYLLYKGLPILMKSPPQKSLVYAALVVVCAIIANLVIGLLLSAIAPNPWSAVGAGRGGAEVSIATPGG